MMKLDQQTQNDLKKLGVQALILFGSRALGVEGPRSDFDFAVLLKKRGQHRGNILHEEIYDLLSPHCPRTLDNDILDIVFLRDAPLELRMHIVRYGKVLFDEDPIARANFEQQVMLEYADYRPILDQFDRVILSSL